MNVFLEEVNALSGESLQLCYGCHKCTSGCPVVSGMIYGPGQMLRMVQLGNRETVLESPDIWLCSGCETCGTRCPNEIDIARVMDALRFLALSGGFRIADSRPVKFHRLFLSSLRRLGRAHEATLLAGYKLWTLDLLGDLDSGARLLVKGKIPLIPQTIRARAEILRIFEAAARADQAGKSRGFCKDEG
jgi:heterodisulfide reductase subunit C